MTAESCNEEVDVLMEESLNQGLQRKKCGDGVLGVQNKPPGQE